MMREPHIARDAVRAAISLGSALPATVSDRRPIMGGHGTITVVGGGGDVLEQAWQSAFRLEALWSRFIPDSDIQRLNWAEGAPVEVAEETVRLITEMKRAHQVTGGDFNPTLLPALVASGYASSLTDPSRVTTLPESARSPGDLGRVVVAGRTVTVPRGTTLDAGGMGKGLAGDIITERVMDEGALGVMVELLGDIVVTGMAPDAVAWRLSIEDPFNTAQQLGLVRLARGAIVTSSQRKRRFDGDRRHHLIDSRTSDSAVSDVQTATVIAGSGAHAEALSKSAFVRSPEEFVEWVPTQSAACLLVRADASVVTSSNWETYR